jgi:hypothetical protein
MSYIENIGHNMAVPIQSTSITRTMRIDCARHILISDFFLFQLHFLPEDLFSAELEINYVIYLK